MKKLTDAYPALTTGAKIPNHWGFEKWKKTILTAAKVRRPVNAFSRSGLRISIDFLDDFLPSADEGCSPDAGGSVADNGIVACGLIIRNQWSVISVQWSAG